MAQPEAYTEAQVGRSTFTDGQFGEISPVEGLADDEVCIGDRYRIGSALFEVTQPRTTCYRVGIRMEEPRMARAHGSDRDRRVVVPARPPAADLERAPRIPALSESWKGSFRALLD